MPWILFLLVGGGGYLWWRSKTASPSLPPSPPPPPGSPDQPPAPPGQPAPPPAVIWQTINADSSGDYTFQNGERYAVLAGVSSSKSVSTIVDFLNGHGWAVTYSWEYGTPTRGQYAIDDTLAALGPDPTSGQRWVYIEGNRTGDTTSVGQTPSWPKSMLISYAIQWVMQAVPNPALAGG